MTLFIRWARHTLLSVHTRLLEDLTCIWVVVVTPTFWASHCNKARHFLTPSGLTRWSTTTFIAINGDSATWSCGTTEPRCIVETALMPQRAALCTAHKLREVISLAPFIQKKLWPLGEVGFKLGFV